MHKLIFESISRSGLPNDNKSSEGSVAEINFDKDFFVDEYISDI